MTEKHTFFVPGSGFPESTVEFPESEARHASRVLRLTAGNEVQVVDGNGGRFRVRIESVNRRGVTGSVLERLADEPAVACDVTLAVGLLKNAGRFETMLEKATELGVRRIVPLVTGRTEADRLRMDRSRGILVAAMKQSGRARLPELDTPTALADLLAAVDQDLRVICHEAVSPADSLSRVVDSGSASVCILVGPEGGFTDDEVEAARIAGFLPVSLGPTRLRTETAALAAATLVLLGARS